MGVQSRSGVHGCSHACQAPCTFFPQVPGTLCTLGKGRRVLHFGIVGTRGSRCVFLCGVVVGGGRSESAREEAHSNR
jgi:hypothetical protein